jgi:hypothetical protein
MRASYKYMAAVQHQFPERRGIMKHENRSEAMMLEDIAQAMQDLGK